MKIDSDSERYQSWSEQSAMLFEFVIMTFWTTMAIIRFRLPLPQARPALAGKAATT
jgi:hypothetical protein